MTTIPFGQCLCVCGKPYCPTWDGKFNHQKMFDHPPKPVVIVQMAPPPPPRVGAVRQRRARLLHRLVLPARWGAAGTDGMRMRVPREGR